METKRITIQFGDRALGSYSADSLQVMMESIEDTFRDCNDKLSGAQMAVSDYVFQADAITEMTENMLKLQAYASTAHEQVYQELDRPLWQDFKDNATESLSQIVLDELSTENTFGMEEHYEVAAIEVEYGQKRVKTELTMRDFMGLPAVEAEEGMPVLEHVEIVGRFAGLFRAEYLEKSQYMDVDKFVEAYLTNGEYLHSAYHPGKDFLSGLLDITIVKPVIESLTGEDMITKERLSDSERAFKAAGAMIDLFTFGQGTLMIDFMGYTGKEALEAFGRTVLVDVFANSAAYTVSYGADAMGLPPEINWILSVTTGCTISVAGGDYILRGLDGSVTKITAADVREIIKGNRKGGSGVKYSPINPGPLSEDVANSFNGATYTERVLTEDTVMYRVSGGNAKEVGSYMSMTPQGGGLQSQLDLALNPAWGNTTENVTKVVVPKGTTIYEGIAAPQNIYDSLGNVIGTLPGGGNQVYIPTVEAGWFQ